MGSFVISLIAVGCVFGGALLGILLRTRLPTEYQDADSKDVVRLGMGLVVTTAAIALGLLIGSAKSFYDTQNAEMAQFAADYVLLDRLFTSYGPEASDARAALRAELARHLEGTGPIKKRNKAYINIETGVQMGDPILQRVQSLSPKDESQRFMKQECLNLLFQLAQTRWLMFSQNTLPFPGFLLFMLISWLTLLFVSFGIFAPRNPVVVISLFASAAAVCGAILLILEMYQPQSGLIRVSDAPLHAAMDQLRR